jgi:hypothetical protein
VGIDNDEWRDPEGQAADRCGESIRTESTKGHNDEDTTNRPEEGDNTTADDDVRKESRNKLVEKRSRRKRVWHYRPTQDQMNESVGDRGTIHQERGIVESVRIQIVLSQHAEGAVVDPVFIGVVLKRLPPIDPPDAEAKCDQHRTRDSYNRKTAPNGTTKLL